MNDLDKLKDLLFGAEKQALDSIADRVERPETRTTDVADVLPEAIHRSHSRSSELVESLTAPVGECLQQVFHKDPQTYSDALYPVMGPAIRKSIAHTLREFSQQINEAVEHSLTPKGLKWRLQAARAGIPFGDFVLQKTLLFRIEQAYLISRDNGLLIEHVHHTASKIKDSDAVSAMFTAIQDFVKESFSPDRTGRLESADMGEFTLWAVHGPHALLVCVIRGVPPRSLRSELSAILERIHFRYGDAVREYAGDTTSVPGVDVELEKCLSFQAIQAAEGDGAGRPWALIIVALLAAALISYFWFSRWSNANELTNFTAALRDTPGIYIAEARRDGDRILLSGMRDPLAVPVADIANSIGIAADSVSAELQAFQSLEPELVARRVAESIGDLNTVSYAISGDTVIVTGEAPAQWIAAARVRVLSVAGVKAADFDSVVEGDIRELTAEVEALSGANFRFVGGITLMPGGDGALRTLAQKLVDLRTRAAASNQLLRVTVIGSTDGAGDAAVNERLAIRRANTAATILSEFGITPDEIRAADIVPAAGTSSLHDANQRKVSVELALVPRTGQ